MVIQLLKSAFNKGIKRTKDRQTSGARSEEAKSFRQDQLNEEAFDTVKRGSCSVPLEQITGSVGRYHDFDDQFRIKKHIPSERLENIKLAMREGKRMPR